MITPDAWAILQDLCDDDPLYLELLAKLLDTERKYQTMSRRTGVYKDLEACFETSARPKAAAIQQAEAIRDMKQAQGGTPHNDKDRDAEESDDSIDVARLPSRLEPPEIWSAPG
ncbi:hypothetical protein XM38_004110 [Halomicronema hongdechloris C2206]|uniref:Uncharacterized protein n=1 Tax=Halomicronema hongdechloris C2206 TaxID=1641165 RepID=A0A1Z3HGR6_9CYAN|nr:DNA modification system-associated small protein [Halomicronema hongdechloris]ASC69484.1 hypothetical protein XM38_004110 [Halomicronema hongdechloris C2206]